MTLTLNMRRELQGARLSPPTGGGSSIMSGRGGFDDPQAPSPDAPAVSVIIPAYNCAGFIEEALGSVFSQTLTDYEVIVVNDGSPDAEELDRLLSPYQDRIVYIKQDNRGPAAARNTGIRAARSAWIAFLDADDLWEPDYLKIQVGMMRDNPEIDVLYPDAVIFGDCPEAGRTFMDLCPSRGEVTFERLVTQECNVLVHVTARRAAILRAGMFDEALCGTEDFDLWLRIVKQGGRIAYHRRPLVRYRRRRGSVSSDPVVMCAQALRVLDKTRQMMSLSPSERSAVERARKRFSALLLFHEGKRALLQGSPRVAIERLGAANSVFRSYKIALVLAGLRLAPALLVGACRLRERAGRSSASG